MYLSLSVLPSYVFAHYILCMLSMVSLQNSQLALALSKILFQFCRLKKKKKQKQYPKFCIHYIWLITLYFILIPKLSLSFSSFTRVLLYKKYQNKTLYKNKNRIPTKKKTKYKKQYSSHHITPNKNSHHTCTHTRTHTHVKTIRTNKINTNV